MTRHDPPRAELLELVRIFELGDLEPTSKDDLAAHARALVAGLNRYRKAATRLYEQARERGGELDIDAIGEALQHFELPATLYSSGLIGTLARAFATEHGRAEKVAAHLREQSTHLTTRIGDGDEMGGRVWRIALEDAVRENRAVLEETAP